MAKEVCAFIYCIFFSGASTLNPPAQTFSTNKYLASPRGNGIDCHRFWEAQYLGVIPVVKHSQLDALYEKTGNSLFIKKFADLTKEVLLEHYPLFEKR